MVKNVSLGEVKSFPLEQINLLGKTLDFLNVAEKNENCPLVCREE